MERNIAIEDSNTAPRRVVVIADPFVEYAQPLASTLVSRGCAVHIGSTLSEAMTACLTIRPFALLTELKFPDGLGLDLVRSISAQCPETRIVVHSWYADIPIAVAGVKAGAADFVPKPTDDEFLADILLHESAKISVDCRVEEPNRIRQEHIEQVMRFTRSNVSVAARQLNLHRRSLQRILKRYAISD